jgi:hypothetical protein
MTSAEQNYAVDNKEMLAIIMFCHYQHHYLEDARHPVEFLKDHHNLQRFMTTKSFTGWQVHWWETLLGYKLNIVYRAGKNNPANSPSRLPEHANAPGRSKGALDGQSATKLLTVRCYTASRHQQLYAANIYEEKVFEDMSPDSLLNLIRKGLVRELYLKGGQDCAGPLGLVSGQEPQHFDYAVTPISEPLAAA